MIRINKRVEALNAAQEAEINAMHEQMDKEQK